MVKQTQRNDETNGTKAFSRSAHEADISDLTLESERQELQLYGVVKEPSIATR